MTQSVWLKSIIISLALVPSVLSLPGPLKQNRKKDDSHVVSISESAIDQVFAKNSTTIHFKWLSDDKIQIIWANGQSDLIFLTPKLSLIGATNASCTFTGKFANDSSAEASVVGCQSSKETVVSIGFDNQVKIFILSDDGTTFEVNQNSLNHHRSR